MTLEAEVREDVARLLAMVCTEETDPMSYELVLAKLTRMAILGTRPRGTGPAAAIDWAYKSELGVDDDDDFSAQKENFIAP
jgi:hypothetical protein